MADKPPDLPVIPDKLSRGQKRALRDASASQLQLVAESSTTTLPAPMLRTMTAEDLSTVVSAPSVSLQLPTASTSKRICPQPDVGVMGELDTEPICTTTQSHEGISGANLPVLASLPVCHEALPLNHPKVQLPSKNIMSNFPALEPPTPLSFERYDDEMVRPPSFPEVECDESSSPHLQGYQLRDINELPEEYLALDHEEEVTSSNFLPAELPSLSQTFSSSNLSSLPTFSIPTSSNNKPLDKAVFQGSSLTMQESLTAILSFAQSEHISGIGLSRLLKLISLHLPEPNNFFSPQQDLAKLLEKQDEPVQFHFYCNLCYRLRASASDLCVKCTSESRSVQQFMTFPIASQIRKICKRPGFLDSIKWKSARRKKNVDNIEDIFDGALYVEKEKQMSSDETDLKKWLTLGYNTDGLQIFNSSQYSLNPFYLVILELPPDKRYRSENLILGGLWASETKPQANVFLLPIYKELRKLWIGIDVHFNGETRRQKLFANVICGSCDAPARAMVLNMKTHSGFYSCPFCYCKGVRYNNEVVVFPFEENVPLRTMQEYQEHVKFAVRNKVLVNKDLLNVKECSGIKGPTLMSDITPNLFASTAIDSMHCLYLGVMRQLLQLWFDVLYKDEPFSAFKKKDILNKRLRELNLPHYLQRVAQSIDKLIYWKASELRSFLFNLSLVLLSGVIEDELLKHFAMLVQGAALCNSSSISKQDLVEADLLLSKFVKKFQEIYGLRHMSYNLHQLLHLVSCVRNLGPLWANSCFHFEDMNGRISNLIHGTRHAGLQVYSNMSIIFDLPLAVFNLRKGPAKDFCEQLRFKSGNYHLGDRINEKVYTVGEFHDLDENTAWVVDELSVLQPEPVNISVFHRLLKSRLLYVSSSYTPGQRLSSYIKYRKNDVEVFGNILLFVKLFYVGEEKYAALVSPLQSELANVFEDFSVTHIHKCFFTEEGHDIVFIEDILTVMLRLKVDGSLYLAHPVNDYEFE